MARSTCVAELAFAEDLHADHALARGLHLLEHVDHRGGVGIHQDAVGVDAREVDVDPRRLRRELQRRQRVAGDAVRADDAAAPSRATASSIAPAHSVVQVPLCLLCSSTMSIMSMPSSRRKRSRSACAAVADWAAVLVSTTTFCRPTWRIASATCGCAPYCVGGLEEAQPLVVAVGQHRREAGDAEARLIRRAARAVRAAAHREARHLDAGVAEDDACRWRSCWRAARRSPGPTSSRSCPRSRPRPRRPACPARIGARRSGRRAAGAACRTGRSLDDVP